MIASNSRFRLTPTINNNGVSTFGRWVHPTFMDAPTASTYIVPSGHNGRADLISEAVYGTPEYFWAIVAFNSPRDPLNWPKVGDVINIPSFEDLVSEF